MKIERIEEEEGLEKVRFSVKIIKKSARKGDLMMNSFEGRKLLLVGKRKKLVIAARF